jgi:predicted RNA-binding protein with PUA-like domain
MNYWLVKQEPTAYPFSQFQKEKVTDWTGVRNFQARNNLKAMAAGDTVFYYHSVEGKAIVGLATVSKTAFPDPTAEEGDWMCVQLKAGKPLPNPLTLDFLKTHPVLKNLPLIRQSRLSVMPITASDAKLLLTLGAGR